MILIADSGATKTDWLLVNDNNTFFTTAGINPYYMSAEKIRTIFIEELLVMVNAEEVKSIFFYGSGCSTENKVLMMKQLFGSIFHNASVEINHDMLAAARATCHRKEGIACILGTGSNACVFDGSKITRQMVSFGYFFGDEGSGTHLGKQLIAHYLKETLPSHLAESLFEKYNLTLEFILDSIYNKPFPNRFLASFAPFILENSEDPFLRKMVASSFDEFFKMGIMKFTGYQKLEAHFVGSIAYHFKEILKDVARTNHVTIGKIQKSVIEGLKEFHTSTL